MSFTPFQIWPPLMAQKRGPMLEHVLPSQSCSVSYKIIYVRTILIRASERCNYIGEIPNMKHGTRRSEVNTENLQGQSSQYKEQRPALFINLPVSQKLVRSCLRFAWNVLQHVEVLKFSKNGSDANPMLQKLPKGQTHFSRPFFLR